MKWPGGFKKSIKNETWPKGLEHLLWGQKCTSNIQQKNEK